MPPWEIQSAGIVGKRLAVLSFVWWMEAKGFVRMRRIG